MKNLKISTKIYLGFSCVLLLALIVAGVGLLGLKSAEETFATYRQLARQTNADGRTDQPILPAADFAPGVYELEFQAGAYLRESALQPGAFLDVIPIRFIIEEAESHYHVPLLLSPYGYSTYRGS